ncbi:MAG: DUF1934 domain-containing protein [Clostridia bacterium]|nr:DUF1934 domain-containing protein [Clostridia bacterium]
MTRQNSETVDRAVRVHIRSVQYDYRESLSERIAAMEEQAARMTEAGEEAPEGGDEGLYDEKRCGDAGEPFEMVTEGRLRMRGNLCELSYMESADAGMEDTRTTLVFSKNRPWVVTITRSGLMRMTLSFEEGRHHLGNYSFGAMQRLFSDQPTVMIASYTRKVCNRILETAGTLDLDYIIEVRGMDTQRTVFSLSVVPLALVPSGFEEDTAEESEA